MSRFYHEKPILFEESKVKTLSKMEKIKLAYEQGRLSKEDLTDLYQDRG